MPLSWNEIRQNAIRFSRNGLPKAARWPRRNPSGMRIPSTSRRWKPGNLHDAHADLDRAVHCYRSQPFTSERQRVEFLFALYQRFTAPLLPPPKQGASAL